MKTWEIKLFDINNKFILKEVVNENSKFAIKKIAKALCNGKSADSYSIICISDDKKVQS